MLHVEDVRLDEDDDEDDDEEEAEEDVEQQLEEQHTDAGVNGLAHAAGGLHLDAEEPPAGLVSPGKDAALTSSIRNLVESLVEDDELQAVR